MQLLKHGAEAKLYIVDYLGRKAVKKVRTCKKYREERLDSKILKERLRTECTLLHKAKLAGIRAPFIWKIVPEESAFIMEFIEGRTMKEELASSKNPGVLCAGAGEVVAKLHSAGLVHGDLTTSNFLANGKSLALVDFGLGAISSKPEDKAVDLLNFKKTFMATQFAVADEWKTVEKSYANAYEKGRAILRHVESIERRARYA